MRLSQNLSLPSRAALTRFALPALLSAAFCVLAIHHQSLGEPWDTLQPMLIAFTICGFFWCVAAQLFAESRSWKSGHRWLLILAGLAAIGARLWCAPLATPPALFLTGGLFLLIGVAPFLHRHAENAAFWAFNCHLWRHIGFSVLASALLFAGLCGLFASSEALFGISFYSNFYLHVWIICAAFVAPLLTLSGIPTRFEAETSPPYPKTIRLLLTYIVLPLSLACAAVIYSYGAKIVLQWALPNGGVVSAVARFGGLGVLAWLIAYPRMHGGGLIGWFCRRFFLLLPLPLLLLAVAIGVRIAQYGLTEARYATLLLLLWLTTAVLLAHTRWREHLPRFLMGGAASLLLLASFGPWSATFLSVWHQQARLEAALTRAGVLAESKIHPTSTAIAWEDRAAISAGVEYLVSRRELGALRHWFAAMPKAQVHRLPTFFEAHDVVADMGLNYMSSYERGLSQEQSPEIDFYHYNQEAEGAHHITISGYDHLVETHVNTDNPCNHFMLPKNRRLSLCLRKESTHYEIYRDGKTHIVFDLAPMLDTLAKHDTAKNNAPAELFILVRPGTHLMIRSISGTRLHQDGQQVKSIAATVLIKD